MPLVLLISYAGALGGAERILLDFARALPGETCLACPDGPLAAAARESGVRVFALPPRGLRLRGPARVRLQALGQLAAHARDARALARELDPDLVVAWGMRSAIACLIGPPSNRPVVFQHNDLLPDPMVARLVRSVARRADLVCALSQAIARDLDPRGQLRDRLAVVYPGVDASRFAPGIEPVQPPEVIVLGALVGWKRPDLALEACALARQQGAELQLRLVGAPFTEDGEGLVRSLQARAGAPDLAGTVQLVGAVADSRAELQRATCLLHCAPAEPFGLAVVEALAAGRPAVVPASAGPAEIVDESCGVLYRPGDAADAARAIVELLSDPARAARMGERGRRVVRERFDRDQCSARFAATIAPVVRRRPAPRSAPNELAIVTVTSNSGGEVGALLSSVERHLPGVRVIVVDCASSDESLAVARAASCTRTVALETNVGFGRACNRGMAEVVEPVVALLNPDVELLDDSLLRLAGEAQRDGRGERLLAPLVLYPDGSPQDTAHPVPGSAADLARAVIPPSLLPARAAGALAPWRSAVPRRIGWAVGCAVLARTETLRRLGPFDERIFLYGEDLDLGLRAGAGGVQTWFCPQARVVHHRAHATHAAFGGEPFDMLARARHDVVARRLGARRARLDDAAQAVTFASRLMLKRALGRPAARERHQLHALLRVRRAAGE